MPAAMYRRNCRLDQGEGPPLWHDVSVNTLTINRLMSHLMSKIPRTQHPYYTREGSESKLWHLLPAFAFPLSSLLLPDLHFSCRMQPSICTLQCFVLFPVARKAFCLVPSRFGLFWDLVAIAGLVRFNEHQARPFQFQSGTLKPFCRNLGCRA